MVAGKFWDTVNFIIRQADIVVIVLDARFVDETMNEELTQKARKAGKPCLFVATKADIAKSIDTEALPKPYVVVSARNKRGKSALRDRILIMAEQNYGKGSSVRVGVLGYPNVGKSSVINMLKGAKSAPTGGLPGKTRGEQFVRTHRRILLMDTPGVIPYKEKDTVKHTITGVIDPSKLKDPVQVLSGIAERYPGVVEEYFGLGPSGEPEEGTKKGSDGKGGSAHHASGHHPEGEEAEGGDGKGASAHHSPDSYQGGTDGGGRAGTSSRVSSEDETCGIAGDVHEHSTEDPQHESIAERIARKKNLLRKGGIPDAERAARMAIAAIQKGKIRL